MSFLVSDLHRVNTLLQQRPNRRHQLPKPRMPAITPQTQYREHCAVWLYNTRRPHMVREHLPPVREKPAEVIQFDRDQVVVQSYVGGLVKSFEKRAA
jgi:hypothetical protein